MVREHIAAGRGFQAEPLSDTPSGMAMVINDQDFAAASAERKLALLAVLAAAENPLVSATDNVSCIACHVSTQLTHLRAGERGVKRHRPAPARGRPSPPVREAS